MVVLSSKMISDWVAFETSDLCFLEHSEKRETQHNGKYSKNCIHNVNPWQVLGIIIFWLKCEAVTSQYIGSD